MTGLGLERRSPLAAVVDGPLTMLFLCVCGMAIGLAIDCGLPQSQRLGGTKLIRKRTGLGIHGNLLRTGKMNLRD